MSESVTPEPVMASAEEEAPEAREAASRVFPTVRFMQRGVYTGFYYLAYGVVFSALTVASLIPADNAMGRGVRDGAEAARKSWAGGRVRTTRLSKEGLATTN